MASSLPGPDDRWKVEVDVVFPPMYPLEQHAVCQVHTHSGLGDACLNAAVQRMHETLVRTTGGVKEYLF